MSCAGKSSRFALVKNMFFPALDLWELLLLIGFKANLDEDNTAMIFVLQTGRAPTLKQSPLVHGEGAAFLHERITFEDTKDPVILQYTGGVS